MKNQQFSTKQIQKKAIQHVHEILLRLHTQCNHDILGINIG